MPIHVHRKKPCRSNDVPVRTTYKPYKSQLRIDFHNSCGYCGGDDFWLGGKRGFHIDHFKPKSLFADLEAEYSNLVYSCPFCNIAKSNDWNEQGYIDPCVDDFDNHLQRNEVGQIVPKSDIGNYMYDKLKLNLLRHRLIWIITELQELIDEMQALGFNDDPKYYSLLENHYTYLKLLRNVQ